MISCVAHLLLPCADKAFETFKDVYNELGSLANDFGSNKGGGAGRKPTKDELEYKPGRDFIGSKNIEFWKGVLK